MGDDISHSGKYGSLYKYYIYIFLTTMFIKSKVYISAKINLAEKNGENTGTQF
jgi:hypothetical protein